MIRKILFLFSISFAFDFLFVLGVQAQQVSPVISGIIKDAGTLKPIPDVNVYIAGSTIGCSTDKNGYYEIQELFPGSYRLVVSCIGYKTLVKKVTITEGGIYRYSFALEQKVYQLPTVVVSQADAELWRKRLKIFKRELIGTSSNADSCTIENPFVLSFKEKDDTLFAYANQPLIIKNKSLGYEIKYFLESFKYFEPSVKYSGLPVFKELKARNPNQEKNWQNRRLETYCGSLRHFLTTAVKDFEFILTNPPADSSGFDTLNSPLKREGFKVRHRVLQKIGQRIWKYDIPINTLEYIYKDGKDYEKIISFNDFLKVTYLRKPEDKHYAEFVGKFGLPENPTSLILLHGSKVNIDNQGRFFDKFRIETFGYWAFERLADTLPFDYSPPDSVLERVNFNE